ncbi:hypothetical protein AB0I68_17730 [Streptomyces sp. NPDC050448]|uniref:RICIN domain-containing protein n=1 Tax=Streptomyces sp. NPDC050448 TaxID=3155404 RepID=UPI003442B7D1
MKQKMVRALVLAAAVPVLVAVAAPAQADGWVTWRNKQTDRWLSSYDDGSVRGDEVQSVSDWDGWLEIQNGDGSYNLQAHHSGKCLVGYYRQVYTEDCNPRRDQTNSWQRWDEISTSTGWKLRNRQTGYILDDEGHGGIYANVNDVNTSKNQRWR